MIKFLINLITLLSAFTLAAVIIPVILGIMAWLGKHISFQFYADYVEIVVKFISGG